MNLCRTILLQHPKNNQVAASAPTLAMSRCCSIHQTCRKWWTCWLVTKTAPEQWCCEWVWALSGYRTTDLSRPRDRNATWSSPSRRSQSRGHWILCISTIVVSEPNLLKLIASPSRILTHRNTGRVRDLNWLEATGAYVGFGIPASGDACVRRDVSDGVTRLWVLAIQQVVMLVCEGGAGDGVPRLWVLGSWQSSDCADVSFFTHDLELDPMMPVQCLTHRHARLGLGLQTVGYI